jgi:hypothetical protein
MGVVTTRVTETPVVQSADSAAAFVRARDWSTIVSSPWRKQPDVLTSWKCERCVHRTEDFDVLDQQVTMYMHHVYMENEGKCRQQCANTIFGIQCLMPESRGKLLRAAHCLKQWEKAHPSTFDVGFNLPPGGTNGCWILSFRRCDFTRI